MTQDLRLMSVVVLMSMKITEQDIPPYPYDEEMIIGLNTSESKKRKTMAISLWPNKVLWYDLSNVSSFAHKTQIRNALNELARNVNTREICIQFKEPLEIESKLETPKIRDVFLS